MDNGDDIRHNAASSCNHPSPPSMTARQKDAGTVSDRQASSCASHDHTNDKDADPERTHFLSVLASFEAYLPYSLASNNLRRRSYYALTRNQRTLLGSLGGKLLRPLLQEDELQESSSLASSGKRGDRSGVKGRLDEVDDRIRRNATFLEEIVREARGFISENVEGRPDNSTSAERMQNEEPNHNHLHSTAADTNQTHSCQQHIESKHTHNRGSSSSSTPPVQDVDKVRSTLKQFARDWSSLGVSERSFAYDPILHALDRIFGSIPFSHRHSLRLLFPGCGLGRLPWEAAMRGFSSQGNEFSFFMLLASHFILNKTGRVQEHVIYPWIHTMSNWRSSDDLLLAVRIPDVDPNSLTRSMEADEGVPGTAPDFSMVAGDFLTVYSSPAERAAWAAVCTVFFLDTARNPISYLETISHVLPVGGYWINLGPLLWHFEGTGPDGSTTLNTPHTNNSARSNGARTDSLSTSPSEGSIELTLEEVLDLIEKMGFTVEERRTLPRQSYTGHAESMLTYEYQCEFWVAKKVREAQRTGFAVQS